MKAKSLLIGFLTGTVVAGAATLLSTPSSGKDLRTRIKTNTDEIKNIIDELKVKLLNIKDDTMGNYRNQQRNGKNLHIGCPGRHRELEEGNRTQ